MDRVQDWNNTFDSFYVDKAALHQEFVEQSQMQKTKSVGLTFW
jgi:hypothetical protein